MNKKNIILCMLGLLCSLQYAFSQNLSNRGREFWVGYGHHQFMEPGQPNSQEMVLYLSAEQAANVTVTIEGTAYVRNYVVPANSVIATEYIPKSGANDARLISLPCTFVPPGFPCGGEGVFTNKGIRIVSNVPIVAYAHIFGSASSGASMLMPVETWGYSYVTLNSKQNYAANCFSWVYAIATADNTVLEITPAATTRAGRPANTPFTVTLMKGQIYQVMAGPETGTTKPEMSGTKIRSIANPAGNCYPIAVFAGSSRTRGEPVTCGPASGGDNDNQQCFPSQAWGKRYLTAPTSNSTTASTPMYNTYKIAIKEPGTVVTRNGTPLTGIINNSYYEFISNEPEYIVSNKPVMVAQFIHSGSACFGGGGVGDPEMMYISPVEQGIKRIGFYRNTRENITVNYLTLIIPTAGVASLTINGSGTFDHTYDHPRLAGYKIVVKRWSAAQAQVVAQSDSAFTAITYGLGNVESYGYNAGTNINNLNAVGSIFNVADTSTTTESHPFTCTNTPVRLSVLLGYPTPPSKLVWLLSQVPGITPNADYTDNSPTPVGAPVIVNGISYYKFSVPGTFNFSGPGTFNIPIMATHPSIDNCNNTERVSYDLIVEARPQTDFTLSPNYTGCVADSVYFNGPSSTASYNINQWLWTFPDGSTSNVQNPVYLFTGTGNQNVTLRLVTEEGCVSDSVRTLTIFPRPSANVTASPANVCQDNGTVTLTGTASYQGTAPVNNYYWNFGNGTSAAAGPHNITYASPGTYNVQYAAGVSATCLSDTIVTPVNVYAKPTTTFTYPAGCLPPSGTVQFTSTASTPDGQAITGYLWNFGDPGSGANNTSTLANPTHNYPTFGNYTITFSVTTANGCTKDTTVTATFNLSPTFSYPALTAVCESVTGTVSVATASVTNGVPGTGVYHAASPTPAGAVTSAGLFSPSIAGPGTHTIWYVFAANSGCTDSVSSTITVNPKPAANFTASTASCLPADGNVQFNYTGSASAGQTYLWNFGHPASGANNTSTLANPSHNFTTGTYTISLTVTTAQGCVDDTSYTTTFNVSPALSWPGPLASVCQSTTTPVSIATATVTNGVTGSGIYQGPGTDAAGNFNPSVAGAGTHTILYIYTATGNCIDTIENTIVVNAKPNASFTYPATCLNTTGTAQFTYNGSAATTYLWNFGDAASGANNTSTLQNPTHNFTTSGSYIVTLTATDGNTCFDDTTITATFNITPEINYPALAPVCESVTGAISVATATIANGVTGTGVYSGPGTDAAGNFNPAIAGPGTHTITYTFTSAGGCVASETSTVTVGAKPSSSFTYSPTTACLPTTGLVQFTYNGSAAASYAWNFGDPASGANNTSTLQNPTHNYSNTGSYTITLVATAANGCTDDTVLVRTFSVTPELAYPALAAVCESAAGPVSVATATVLNGVSGTGVYSGPGTDAAGNFNPAVAGPGTHTITYTFTSTGNCVATRTSQITVNAKPSSSFTFSPSTPCIPVDGQVQFTYNGTAVSSYLWNFGDPASGANNTSTAASPTHTYSNTGSYNINLSVTGANGCTDDTTVTRTFSVTPDVVYAPLSAPVCESATGTISVATASVINGVSGTGVYSGPGTDAAGNFNPATAGPGTHTITYTFTSTGGCVATAQRQITVNPRPVAVFSVTADLCLGQQALITNNSTISSGSIATWNWTFGDNTNASNTNGAPFNHNYTAAGSYNVQLVAVSDSGCTSLPVQHPVAVHAVPVSAFVMPASVCMPGGTVTFDNNSTTSDNASMTYQWTFGDTNGSTDENPTHIYASSGSYQVGLVTTTQFGCTATSSQTFSAFFDKPLASFVARPDTVCLGTPIQFTSASNAPGSTINAYSWNLGDGTVTSTENPTRTYTRPGEYVVKLVVSSTEGCTSDTAYETVVVYQQPVIDAGPSFTVAQGTMIQFQAESNAPDYTFQWTPAGTLSDATVLNPLLQANEDATYILTATGEGGCTDTDQLTVKIFRPVKITNAFSPNGDGINDTWVLDNVKDYPGVRVEVFNRYGQLVFSSFGYSTPWDGTMKGKPLPVATYYYIINLQNGFKPMNGSVTIIR